MPPLHPMRLQRRSTSCLQQLHTPSLVLSTPQQRQQQQRRGAATTRRMVKALRTAPAATAAPGSKYHWLQSRTTPTSTSTSISSSSTTTATTTTLVFNPPPSAPSPYTTPPLFLPSNDARKTLLAQAHLFANPYATGTRALPPAVRKPAPVEKRYNLSEADIEELRALRASDPWTWTVPKLAERFGCSKIFVGIAAPASQERREWGKALHQRFRDRWGPKRMGAVEDRHKRRRLWERDL